MTHSFEPSKRYRLLLVADILVFAIFYLLPQFEVVESIAVRSALELDGFGAVVALAHPLSIAVHTTVRILFVGFLFIGQEAGKYFLFTSMFLSCISAAISGLWVLTALDALALTTLYFLDGYLLCRTLHAGRTSANGNALAR